MIKWDVILSSDSFYKLHCTPRLMDKERKTIRKFQEILEQHNIVISASLRKLYEEYYIENADESEFDAIETMFDELSVYASDKNDILGTTYITVNSVNSKSINEILKKTADSALLHHPLILCDTADQLIEMEKDKQGEITFPSSDVLFMKINNKIYRNSVVFTKDLKSKDYLEFRAWLKEAFSGENSIDIIDPYFNTNRGIKVFISYYIFNIEMGATVKFYTTDKEVCCSEQWKRLFNKAQQRKLKIHVFLGEISDDFDFHERRIYLNTSQRHIAIGHGIDAIKEKIKDDGSITIKMRDCHITIDKEMEYRDILIKEGKFKEISKEELLNKEI